MSDNNIQIAELLFGDKAKKDVSFYENLYKERDLDPDAKVTRFAPSPTGFLHIGGVFAALVSSRLAIQSGGVFFLRIEDTDKKREISGGISEIVGALREFNINIEEGVTGEGGEVGDYGPYRQSDRGDIYFSYIKELIKKGRAYPCFCSQEELDELRKKQEEDKVRPGYYGKWAKHRDMSLEDIKRHMAEGKSYVIRLRSEGSIDNKEKFIDQIKGEITVTGNDQDIVLIKSDGLPTYHFAHVVDDHLMRTTHVIRGDEWLPSLPIHLELFRAFGFELPYFGHIAPILKSDNGSKRKLSKRKDPEAAVAFYLEEGYPREAVVEYLLNIANSDFEDWRRVNPDKPNSEFEIKLDRFSKSGAIFDIVKITDISKEIISKFSAIEALSELHEWSRKYDKDLHERIFKDRDYFIRILSIERGGENPRKDIAKWADARDSVFYFFDDMFEEYIVKNPLPFPQDISTQDVRMVLEGYAEHYKQIAVRDEWFADLKDFGGQMGFAKDTKEYKVNPANFRGSLADLAMIVRVGLTAKAKAPDLHSIMLVMGEGMVKARLSKVAGRV